MGLAAAGLVAVFGGGALVRKAEEARRDARDPNNLKEFLGSDEIFDGWHPYYLGQVKLRAGTVIYNRLAQEKQERLEGGLLTTNLSSNTRIGEVKEGDGIVIDRPFIFLAKPLEGFSNPSRVRQVVGPGGVMIEVDLGNSWIIFPLKQPNVPDYISGDVAASIYGATPIGNANLDFRMPGQENGSIIPDGLNITFETNLSFGEVLKP